MRRRREKSKPGRDLHLHRRSEPGSSPGVIRIDPRERKSVVHVMGYNAERCTEQLSLDIAKIPKFIEQNTVTWINVEGLGDASVVEQLGEIFKLHRLALEDVVNVHQRAKVEEYGDVLFIVLRMAMHTDHVCTEQLSMFVGKGFVLTFQEGEPGDPFDRVRVRIRNASGKIRAQPADYLAYALIDAAIDHFYPVLEVLADRIESLEDAVMSLQGHGVMDELHRTKSDLLILRRAIWPQRDAIALLARETEVISENTRLFLRDCYDHVVQIVDLVETYRELTADLRDLHMSSISNRINETMRVLTIIATIFIPLTFITSIYGMNFDTHVSPLNMPELEWYFGYPFVWATMLITTFGMLAYFWRQGWIFRKLS